MPFAAVDEIISEYLLRHAFVLGTFCTTRRLRGAPCLFIKTQVLPSSGEHEVAPRYKTIKSHWKMAAREEGKWCSTY